MKLNSLSEMIKTYSNIIRADVVDGAREKHSKKVALLSMRLSELAYPSRPQRAASVGLGANRLML